MQTRNLGNTIFLTAVACLLIWNVAGSRPTVVAEVPSKPAATRLHQHQRL